MPKQKKNHFVGRGVIKFWANEKGQVTYWNKNPEENFETRNPKTVHYAEYLNANWDVHGNRDMSAEDALAKEIDNQAASHIEELVAAYPNVVPLSRDQRAFFARMVLRTIIRNPAMLDHLANTWHAQIIRGLYRLKRRLQRGRTADRAYEKLGKDRVILGEMVSDLAVIDIDQRVQEISQKRFVLLVPDEGSPNFILGSQPYFINPAMLDSAKNRDRKKDAFCGIVLHPRILLTIFDDQDNDQIIIADKKDMQRINGIFLKYSSTVVIICPNDLDGAWYRPLGFEETDRINKIDIRAP